MGLATGRLAAGLGRASPAGPKPHRREASAGLILAFGVLCVGSAAIFFELAEAPALVKAAWRLSLASLLLAPVAFARAGDELRRLSSADWRRAVAAGLALMAHFGLWVPSLDYTSVASSVILVTTSPLFVGLLSPWWLGEAPTRGLVAGFVIAFGGAAWIMLGDGAAGTSASAPLLGDLLALGGALAAAIYFLLGRQLRGRLSLIGYVFVVYTIAALGLVGLTLLLGIPLLGYAPRTWLIFLALAVIPQLLGHSSFNWALKNLSAAYVSTAVLGEPIVSALLAWWLLSQRPGAAVLAGGGLILVGLGLATRGELGRARRSRTESR